MSASLPNWHFIFLQRKLAAKGIKAEKNGE
jgi:hypothetical protein